MEQALRMRTSISLGSGNSESAMTLWVVFSVGDEVFKIEFRVILHPSPPQPQRGVHGSWRRRIQATTGMMWLFSHIIRLGQDKRELKHGLDTKLHRSSIILARKRSSISLLISP